ncbi:MAG: DUF2490 domain-containing protein [Flavobacteriales bacterium]|jgi:hypothetical protein|nr:DUF2490 domain-containing protein [Flavobacteriales bacterium]
MRRFTTVLIILFVCAAAQGQTEKEINNQAQFWTSINSTWRFSDHWGAMGDFHIRRTNFIQDPNFYFLRLGGVYWINDKISLAGGAAALWLAKPDMNDGFNYALEKRIYQQLLWRSVNGRAKFLQRIRNEQRWHEVLDPEGSVNRIRFSNRVRFLFSASIRIFEDEKKPRLVLSDEILFHFGKEIVYNTFDQNRLFIGISQRLNKRLSYDFGYMAVYQQKYSGYNYDLNHTLRLFFYSSPDLRKKKDEKLPHYPVGDIE